MHNWWLSELSHPAQRSTAADSRAQQKDQTTSQKGPGRLSYVKLLLMIEILHHLHIKLIYRKHRNSESIVHIKKTHAYIYIHTCYVYIYMYINMYVCICFLYNYSKLCGHEPYLQFLRPRVCYSELHMLSLLSFV